MADRLLAEQWATFVERVLPPAASPLQLQEMRRAFYAGAEALLRSLMKTLDPGAEATDADLARMEGIETELRDFARDVAEGRA